MAGAANCAKLRLTGRQQWFGQTDAPALQTASFNGRIGEQSGAGIILYNDKNGYHSQRGAKVTYAHHIMFSRSEIDLDQLSFGMSAGFTQQQLDETSFTEFDPVTGNRIQREAYFNVDIGASYNYLDYYAHLTVKNALPSKRDLYTDVESNNLTRYIFSTGYSFGENEKIQWEPSLLFQYVDQTKEKILDLNLKAYKDVDFGKLWLGLSYRRAFDAAQFTTGGAIAQQRLQYVTPVLGVNYKQFMFAYTYSHLLGNVLFDQGGFHQITLGLNIFCKREKYDCNCPAIN
jgi:type IX secretion system PorP/SprF family membrane protein